jgi:hypothetical protein
MCNVSDVTAQVKMGLNVKLKFDIRFAALNESLPLRRKRLFEDCSCASQTNSP